MKFHTDLGNCTLAVLSLQKHTNKSSKHMLFHGTSSGIKDVWQDSKSVQTNM